MRFRDRAIIVLDQHYLINVDAIEHIETVHESLRRQQQPVCGGSQAADEPCSCRLQLLIVELSNSPKGKGLATMVFRRMAQLMQQSQHAYQANPDSPVSRLPADPFGQPPRPALQPAERASQPVARAQPDTRDYTSEISRTLQRGPHGQHIFPRPAVPSAPPAAVHTCMPESDLVACSAQLAPGHQLFLPKGDQLTEAKVQAAQRLYSLLERLLQQVFAGGGTVSNLNVFYDDRSETIAFNAGRSQLWFNAYHDPVGAERHAREEFWFHTVCHELAHQYVSPHCSAFADRVGAITFRASKQGRRFLKRTDNGEL